MKTKRCKLALVAMILTGLYLIYLGVYFGDLAGSAKDGAEQLSTGITVALVSPHILMVGLSLIFNALGYFMNSRGFTLTAAILLSVAILFMPIYFMFVLVQMVLLYVAQVKIANGKKIEGHSHKEEIQGYPVEPSV